MSCIFCNYINTDVCKANIFVSFSGKRIRIEAEMASNGVFLVNSPNVRYSKEFIEADYDYQITKVASNGGVLMVSCNSF